MCFKLARSWGDRRPDSPTSVVTPDCDPARTTECRRAVGSHDNSTSLSARLKWCAMLLVMRLRCAGVSVTVQMPDALAHFIRLHGPTSVGVPLDLILDRLHCVYSMLCTLCPASPSPKVVESLKRYWWNGPNSLLSWPFI